ncbi:MAG: hypothetical protein D6B27_02650 [Gammaproteobacteria bacterium]|nr:MAG: hypothetical protein D6B27_02650 [Gammaproteobacteria bacterium]
MVNYSQLVGWAELRKAQRFLLCWALFFGRTLCAAFARETWERDDWQKLMLCFLWVVGFDINM